MAEVLADDRKVLIFKIENEEYATGISQVERIIEFGDITRIPEAPDFLRGVINNQGRVVPVIDLKKRFGLPDTSVSGQPKIIAAKQDSGDVGLIVDDVSEVTDIPGELLSPTPEMVICIVKEYIKGIIKLEDRLVILINLERILDFSEREAVNEIIG